MEVNRDPLFPHLCPGLFSGDDPNATEPELCAICRWLRMHERLDQFYRERHGEKASESD